MTERGRQLHGTADGQITELIVLISTSDEATLRLPCPGREKLGDGTVAACAAHTAHNYERIATFTQAADQKPHREHGPDSRGHADQYTADNVDLPVVLQQLSVSRDALSRIAELTDSQLDAIPPKDSFRFCDGQRTLEQVLAGFLNHQGHQLDVLRAATR